MTGDRAYSNYRGQPDGPGFYVDSATQREKARRAEQVLAYQAAQHEQWLRQNPGVRYEIANEIASERHTPPPVLKGYEDRTPSISPDKYAARFRDGLPPPPPPRLREEEDPRFPNGRPQRPRARLIPQEQFDAGLRRPARSDRTQRSAPAYPPPLLPSVRASLIPEDVSMSASITPASNPPVYNPAESSLSPSQKKRLRKKRAKLSRQTPPEPQSAYAPTYAPPDPGAVYPTPNLPPRLNSCPAEEIVRKGQTQFRIRCDMKEYPHPNEPHMMALPCDSDPDVHVFIGWWK